MTSSSFIRKTFFSSKLLSLQRCYMDSEPDMGLQVWVNLQVKKKMVLIINTVSTFLFFIVLGQQSYGFPSWLSGEESTCQCRRHKRCKFDPWVGKIPWNREWQLTPVFLPGRFHGQRSLAGCSPQSCRERDMTEHTHMHAYI